MNSDVAPVTTFKWGERPFEDIMGLQAISESQFRSTLNEDNGGGLMFGGQILGHTLLAAGRTLSSPRPAQSLQLSFSRPGILARPMDYTVESIGDGRKMSSRVVRIGQMGRTAGIANACFLEHADGFDRQEHANGHMDPEALPGVQQLVDADPDLKIGYGLATIARKSGLDFRLVAADQYVSRSGTIPRFQFWMRLPRAVSDNSPLVHQAASLYLTDYLLAFAPMLPTHSVSRLQKMWIVTLNHSAWFYKPFRADDWLYVDAESPALSGGRGLVLAKVYLPGSGLAAIITQELLYGAPPDAKSPTAANRIRNPEQT